jgi:DNA-binding MarR family transcriptional regulator
MKIEELDIDIKKHKDKSPNTYHDIINVTVPFYMLYGKLIKAITLVQEEKFNVSNSELDVLGSLKMSGGDDFTLSPTKLYERLLFSSGGMTKVLKKLEDKNFIKRIDNSDDKRSKLVQLTNEGSLILEKTLKAVILEENEIFSNLNEDDRKTLKNLLVKTLKDSKDL